MINALSDNNIKILLHILDDFHPDSEKDDETWYTPLLHLCTIYDSKIHDINIFEIMLKKGADPNYYQVKDNIIGTCALLLIIENNNCILQKLDIIKILIKYGADVNLNSQILLAAIVNPYPDLELVKLLLDANIEKNNGHNGLNPLETAQHIIETIKSETKKDSYDELKSLEMIVDMIKADDKAKMKENKKNTTRYNTEDYEKDSKIEPESPNKQIQFKLKRIRRKTRSEPYGKRLSITLLPLQINKNISKI